MLALQAGVLDPRVDAVCVSGQFGPREDMWREPLERNLFGFLNHFGDAELTGLLADRALVVEAAKGPEVVIDSTGAAPGRLITPTLAKVRDEFSRAKFLVSSGKSDFSLFSRYFSTLPPKIAYCWQEARIAPRRTAAISRGLQIFAP